MRRLSLTLTLMLGLAVLSASCSAGDRNNDGGGARKPRGGGSKLQVVASFFPAAEAAARIGGTRVDVTNLTPAGAEPHDLELTTDQVDQLEDADLVLFVGKGFQPAIESGIRRRNRPSINMLSGLSLHETASEGESKEELDLHFWLDPLLMVETAKQIEDAMTDLDPSGAEQFRSNAYQYDRSLRSLDKALADGLAQCERREIVTTHAAFDYLAKRYGLVQHAIAGLSPESEPDAAVFAKLTSLIRSKNVTTVFSETLGTSDPAEALAREAGVRTAVLHPIETLTRDELDDHKDYATLMRGNLAALRKALDCT